MTTFQLLMRIISCSCALLLLSTFADAQTLPLNCTGDDQIGGCYVVYAPGATAHDCQTLLENQFVLRSPPVTLPNGNLFAGNLVPAAVTADGQCCLQFIDVDGGGCSKISALFISPEGCDSAQVTKLCSAAASTDDSG
jgi:hypothetical protein